MSSSSSSAQNQTRTARMATRQQSTNQANQVGECFVFFYEYSDDPDTSAHVVCLNMPLPTKMTEQVFDSFRRTTDTATFNARAMDDNDEPWATEADHRTGWSEEFKSGTHRGMLYGIVLRDYPKQVVSLATAKSVPANMREFLSLGHKDIIALR